MRIERAKLLQALELAEPGLARKESVDQSSCYVFTKGQLVTYNDLLACRIPSPLGTAVAGAVPAKNLLKILGKIPDETLDVSVGPEYLTLKGKGRRTRLRLEREVRLPIEAVEEPASWRPVPEELIEVLRVVGRCAGTDPSKFSLMCVHLAPAYLECFDNQQFCRHQLETGLKNDVFVTQDTLKHLQHRGAQAWSLTRAWLHFKSALDLVISCRRYQTKFPDLTPLLEAGGTKLTLPKGLAAGALIAQIVAEEITYSDGSKSKKYLEVSLRRGAMRVTGLGPLGEHAEQRQVDYQGPELEFLMTPEVLVELANRHTECRVLRDRLHVHTPQLVYATRLGRKKENGDEVP